MKLQQLYSYTRQALDDYEMIQDGDRIAIGLSGGKDSIALLYALSGLQKFYPKKFEIEAFTCDIGFEGFHTEGIEQLCKTLEVPYHVIHTEIASIAFQDKSAKKPCYLCSKLRKGALNDAFLKANCNKIAYAHHMDDVIETMMLSLIFEGRIHTFSPKTYLDRTGLTLIRPLIYMKEAEIIGFINKYQCTILKNPCPVDGFTKREYVKQLIKEMNHDHPGVKERIFRAILNGNLEGWPTLEELKR